MGKKIEPTGWPAPWAPIDKANAGAMIKVSADTIERVARAVARGEPVPKVREPKALAVGRLFADAESGTVSRTVSAVLVYRVIKVNPKTLKGPFIEATAKKKPPKGKRRNRNVVPSEESLSNLSIDELNKELAKAVQQVRASSGGKVPWRRLKAVADTLTARGLPPQGVLHGQTLSRIDLSKCETWGFVGVFMAQAEPTDLWPFVLPAQSRRPVDLFSASADDIKHGQLIGLTVEEWVELMAAALADERRQERSESEAEFLKAAVQPAAENTSNSNEAP